MEKQLNKTIMKLTLINMTWSGGRWSGFLYLPLNDSGSPVLNMDKFEKLTGFHIPRGSTFTIS